MWKKHGNETVKGKYRCETEINDKVDPTIPITDLFETSEWKSILKPALAAYEPILILKLYWLIIKLKQITLHKIYLIKK